MVIYDDGDVKTYTTTVLQKRLERATQELGINFEEVGGKVQANFKTSATDNKANEYLFGAEAKMSTAIFRQGQRVRVWWAKYKASLKMKMR